MVAKKCRTPTNKEIATTEYTEAAELKHIDNSPSAGGAQEVLPSWRMLSVSAIPGKQTK